MLATQEIQNNFSIPDAVSIDLEGYCQEIASAERELGAFLKAVQSLYGDEAAVRAADDWIEIAQGAPAVRGLSKWRYVTVLASSRLASNCLGHLPQESGQMEGKDAD